MRPKLYLVYFGLVIIVIYYSAVSGFTNKAVLKNNLSEQHFVKERFVFRIFKFFYKCIVYLMRSVVNLFRCVKNHFNKPKKAVEEMTRVGINELDGVYKNRNKHGGKKEIIHAADSSVSSNSILTDTITDIEEEAIAKMLVSLLYD